MLTTADKGGVVAAVSWQPVAPLPGAHPSAAHRLHPCLPVAVHRQVASGAEGATAQLLADAGCFVLLHVPAHGAPASLHVHLQLPGAAAAATGEPQEGGCGESRAIRGFPPLPAAPRWFSSWVWFGAAVRLSTTAAAGAAGSMGQEGNGGLLGVRRGNGAMKAPGPRTTHSQRAPQHRCWPRGTERVPRPQSQSCGARAAVMQQALVQSERQRANKPQVVPGSCSPPHAHLYSPGPLLCGCRLLQEKGMGSAVPAPHTPTMSSVPSPPPGSRSSGGGR